MRCPACCARLILSARYEGTSRADQLLSREHQKEMFMAISRTRGAPTPAEILAALKIIDDEQANLYPR